MFVNLERRPLGPGIEVVLLTKGLVFQRLREHRKVSGGKDHFSRELHRLLSRLNETRGGSLKIDAFQSRSAAI